MIFYLSIAIYWGIIFGVGIFPSRACYNIVCPPTLGWRVLCSLIHAAMWPISLIQVAGWMYLNHGEKR